MTHYRLIRKAQYSSHEETEYTVEQTSYQEKINLNQVPKEKMVYYQDPHVINIEQKWR